MRRKVERVGVKGRGLLASREQRKRTREVGATTKHTGRAAAEQEIYNGTLGKRKEQAEAWKRRAGRRGCSGERAAAAAKAAEGRNLSAPPPQKQQEELGPQGLDETVL